MGLVDYRYSAIMFIILNSLIASLGVPHATLLNVFVACAIINNKTNYKQISIFVIILLGMFFLPSSLGFIYSLVALIIVGVFALGIKGICGTKYIFLAVGLLKMTLLLDGQAICF